MDALSIAHQLFSHLDPLVPPHGLPILNCLPVFISDVERHCLELATSSDVVLFFLGFYLVSHIVDYVQGEELQYVFTKLSSTKSILAFQT